MATKKKFSISNVDGLTSEEREVVRTLEALWREKLPRNLLRLKYYDGKNRLKDLGIAIPPPLKDVNTVVGWAAKSVDELARRSRFDGFYFDGIEESGVEQIVKENRLQKQYRQALSAELTNSCAFMSVSNGTEPGEPDVIVSSYSAVDGAATWNTRKKRIQNAMVVHDVDPKKRDNATWVNVYFDEYVLEVRKDDEGTEWYVDRVRNPLGRPLIEPLIYKQSLFRPFGYSRVNSEVMSIVDAGVRCCLRAEVAAEFAAAPQKYLLGADDDVFDEVPKWEAYIGNIFSVGKDADGDLPHFGQLTQPSMEPHTTQLRNLAARLSGATNIPVSMLGIIHDNPASAEAINAAADPLIADCEVLNEDNGEALSQIMLMSLALQEKTTIDKLPDSYRNIAVNWKSPARTSMSADADAVMKLVSMFPWMVEAPRVPLEMMNVPQAKIDLLIAQKERAEGQIALTNILNEAANAESNAQSS